ncbi:MAG: TolC family protein [Paludibacter sp.]|nr:TolC family protein [Paludibacter sp.]
MMRLKVNIILLLIPLFVTGQTLSLDSCRKKAYNNYPLLKQFGLIEKAAEYNLSNANKNYLPQLNFSARATYQSDVTEIPASLGQILSQITGRPVTFPSLSRDQYQATLEVSQLVWDGGLISAQKKNIKAAAEAEKQKLEVDLFALNERVNNLYFGTMLINEQLTQLNILQHELAVNFKRVEALKQNGVAQQSDIDAIKVEQINAHQRETELKSMRKTYLQLLSAFTGTFIDENVIFEKPALPVLIDHPENKRPELLLFLAQNKLYDIQREAVHAANLPKIGLFVQGGYGRPGLNMFTSEFSPYYIGGVRFSWNLSSFYTQKTNLEKLEVGRKNVEVMKETFLFNNNLISTQQQNEIEKLKTTLKNDDEIIDLRNNIKKIG